MYKVLDFCHLRKKFGKKYGKKIVNKGITAAKRFNKSKYGKVFKKEGLKFAKTSGRKILKRDAESTGDLIGNKIADKITSIGNKPEEQPEEQPKEQENIIPPERRQQIIDNLRLFYS